MIDSNEIYKIIGGILGKYIQNYFREQKPRSRKRKHAKRRGKYAERSVSQYFRKKGCGTFTNVFDVREIDVVAVCYNQDIAEVYIIEVKSGRQLIDLPVLSRLRYIFNRIKSRKTPFIYTNRKVSKVEIIPALIMGPLCSLSPRAENYARKYNIRVYRYRTKPIFDLEPLI